MEVEDAFPAPDQRDLGVVALPSRVLVIAVETLGAHLSPALEELVRLALAQRIIRQP